MTAVNAALAGGVGDVDAGVADTAVVREETPDALTIETAGSTTALLVLADLAFPGWHADIDGRAAPVLTVDGVLRGVVVPAGVHRVGFRYRPTSVMVGALLTGLALVALVPFARTAAGRHRDGASRPRGEQA